MSNLVKKFQPIMSCATFLVLLLPWNRWLNTKMDIMNSLALPSLEHPLGTDSMGRDFLVRFHDAIISSILPIWAVCTLVTILGILTAIVVLGCNFRKTDYFINLLNLLIVSIPTTIISLFLSVYFEEVCFEILVITLSILIFSRNYSYIHSQYVRCMNLGYWKSHEMMGGNRISRLINYGILGAWKRGIVELFFVHLQLAFIIEITLSYLGFGIQEPYPSFGNMFKSHFDLVLRGDIFSVFIIVCFMGITLWVPKSLYNMITASPYISRTDPIKSH